MTLAAHEPPHAGVPALDAAGRGRATGASLLERSAAERLLMTAAALVALGLAVGWALL